MYDEDNLMIIRANAASLYSHSISVCQSVRRLSI